MNQFFEAELRPRQLAQDIDDEGVGNYVFIYADELDAFVKTILPFSAKSVTNLNALILYEYLNCDDNVNRFIENTTAALFRLLNNEYNQHYLFRYSVNRLSETEHIAIFLTTLESQLDWAFYFLRHRNPDVLVHCSELTRLGMDYLWRGKLGGQYVFQPFIPSD